MFKLIIISNTTASFDIYISNLPAISSAVHDSPESIAHYFRAIRLIQQKAKSWKKIMKKCPYYAWHKSSDISQNDIWDEATEPRTKSCWVHTYLWYFHTQCVLHFFWLKIQNWTADTKYARLLQWKNQSNTPTLTQNSLISCCKTWKYTKKCNTIIYQQEKCNVPQLKKCGIPNLLKLAALSDKLRYPNKKLKHLMEVRCLSMVRLRFKWRYSLS